MQYASVVQQKPKQQQLSARSVNCHIPRNDQKHSDKNKVGSSSNLQVDLL